MQKRPVTPEGHDLRISVRVPDRLGQKLEADRRKLSRLAGTELKVSDVIRALLERPLPAKRTAEASP